MIDSQDEERTLKRRQSFFILAIVAIALVLLTTFFLNQRSNVVAPLEPYKFDFPSDKIDPNVMRIQNLEAQIAVNEMENNALKSTLTSILKQMEANQQLLSSQLEKQSGKMLIEIDQKLEEESRQLTVQLEKKIHDQIHEVKLQEGMSTVSNPMNNHRPPVDKEIWNRNPIGPPKYYEATPSLPEEPMKVQKSFVVVDCGNERVNKKRWLKNSIPMGLSVKAILLSGVDAVCGVYSKSEPVPVKLQLLEEGKLPNHLRSKVKRAVILASAYGDISSERVIMRLEKLRITNLDGSYYDTAISGYITGEDGKYGVRGKVVDRSCKMIKNAATSGVLQEISNLAQASISKPNINISSLSSAPQMLGGGVVGGSSRALDMLADYYIQRAEHVQPVLEVDAGRIIDVTFTFSVDIGDLDVKERIEDFRNDNRTECEE